MSEVSFVGIEKPRVIQGSPVFKFKCTCGKTHYLRVDIMNMQISVALGTQETPMPATAVRTNFNARTVT